MAWMINHITSIYVFVVTYLKREVDLINFCISANERGPGLPVRNSVLVCDLKANGTLQMILFHAYDSLKSNDMVSFCD